MSDLDRDEPIEAYEAPAVEDLDNSDDPAVTAAGADSIQVS